VFSKELGGPGATRVDHPSRTDRGDGRYRGPTLHRSRLIRYPDAPRNRSKEGKPPEGRGFGTGFSHTVEFSRNVAGLLFGDSPAVPASRHRRSGGTVPRAFQARQRLPTCPDSVLLVEHHPPRRHLHTEAPPCARPSGRQDGHRTAVGLNPLGVRRPPVFRCRRRWRRPERSSVSKIFPACSLEKVAPGLTACQLDTAAWTRATTRVPAPSRATTAGARAVFRSVRTRGPATGPGTAGRPSAGGRRARPAASSARSSRPAGRRAGPPPG
jgi:hypothetical protein